MYKRIFVKKKADFAQSAVQLLLELRKECQLQATECASYIIYDIDNIDEALFEKAKYSVFAERVTDEVFESLTLMDDCYIAFETLPAQYDQRADSAMQCLALLDFSTQAIVKTGQLLVFNAPLTPEQKKKVLTYLVNPIESREKDLTLPMATLSTAMTPLRDLTGFIRLSVQDLQALKAEMNLAMPLADLQFTQAYFQSEQRDPSETELYVLDCYWSDHCRHTTFETVLNEITFSSELFATELQAAYQTYLDMRQALGSAKPVTLMDMASVVGKYHRQILGDQTIEVSDEVNACSFYTTITVDGKEEEWLIQFKNETHNHPSEIEPFGGASTCIGGAIRDPLSGRSYVYQAMRVSGCGNVLQKRSETLPYKLPQSVIATGTAKGYSSYGNQIGLATTHVKELYDDSYVAKHMEVGAVVGAVKVGDFKREAPKVGDWVIVIGGRTGRDGIQGASGSSVSHTNDSLNTAASQVQKGNPIEERKLQRLFRNPSVTQLIKKCNDFGAGGVCVAIGELAEGIEIHLDRLLVKYQGLNATELATSESQERLAVVINPSDAKAFFSACRQENIEYAHVATITDRRRLEMYYHADKVVDMDADFLATSGVRQNTDVEMHDNEGANPFVPRTVSKEAILAELTDLNVTSQKGLIQQFDASIGATTVLMPFAGKHQLTPTQASVQALPTLYKTGDTATVLTYGFVPKISHYSPFISAIYAVLESVAKVFAVGGNTEDLYFSFQEYFEKLGDNPVKWGKVTQSLLGTIYAQQMIGRPSIGGKDSMSGTFNELNVVESLISFACVPMKIADVITPELKRVGNRLYHVPVVMDERGYPDIQATMENYQQVHHHIQRGEIVSAYVQEAGSLSSSLVKMALGTDLGFVIESDKALNFTPASLVVEATVPLTFDYLGEVTSGTLSVNGIELERTQVQTAYTNTLDELYPIWHDTDIQSVETLTQPVQPKRYYPEYVDEVKVVIPVFPGTNCEYDTEKAFRDAGAITEVVLIRNLDGQAIQESIENFVQAVTTAHIIAFPGGFSSGDEPDGSAKFIVNFLKNTQVTTVIHQHLAQKKLILGICNGFQALIKSGLLPYGEIKDVAEQDLTLYHNTSYRHISRTAITRVANVNSPWTQGFELDALHEVLFSHGEGRLVGASVEQFKHLAAFQYCDTKGVPGMHSAHNPNGSTLAIEGLISENGLILGKMGHSERYGTGLYKTNYLAGRQDIFGNGVQYFKGGN
ncbi:phosphoribosylformylglycinamidine synthase [Aerococcaceae bacterium NML190938]|nr:phosphoribosylformylglycinamidine synthase [Aerococcaceae bacterium NML190938]